MAREDPYAPRRPAANAVRLTQEQGCWVRYQLNLRNLVYKTVAHEGGICVQTVAHFMYGGNSSPQCKAALCRLLGYETFGALLEAANAANAVNGKGGGL
jgi:hypothetical protein